MAEHPLGAVYKAIRTRLIDDARPWGKRVYADLAITGASESASDRLAMPYVVYSLAAGGRVAAMPGETYEYSIDVLTVAASATQGLQLAQHIAELLAESGEQDAHAARLESGPDWRIETITRDADVHLEFVLNGRAVWTSGGTFRVTLNARA